MLELLSAEETGITFANDLHEDDQLNIITFEYLYNGAGVGVGDVNNDGLSDLFFSANMSENQLYVNKGDFQFENITEKSGLIQSGKWATGVSMIDINQDGWLDIYVCYAGPFADSSRRANELYINNHDNTFTESAKQYGLADTGHSIQAAFFDYDRDGDLDVYLLTNITDETGPNVIRPKRLHGEMINTDRLYRNNGNGTFNNISKEAGILAEGYGLGVSICDINKDGWPDVYVSNDYLSNDLMYINNGDGTFTDKASDYFDHTSYSAMGNDIADYNNDGWLDIIAVDMLPPDNKRQKLMFGATNYARYRSELRVGYTPQFMRNTLQLGRGIDANNNLVFSEIGQLAGVSATDWSWSPLFADIDNDGWRDLLVTNGYPRDITNRDFANYKANEFMRQGSSKDMYSRLRESVNKLEGAHLPNYAFRNNGNLTFSDSSAMWGFIKASYSTGAAFADLDNDGDLDYVTNNINAPASVFKNHAREINNNRYIRIKLQGPQHNNGGTGTKVLVTSPTKRQYIDHSTIRGFQSTVESTVHFGLGTDTLITSIVITWPDGKTQQLNGVKVDQLLTVKYNDHDQATDSLVTVTRKPYLREGGKYQPVFRHDEPYYDDFKIQPLLPRKYSQDGPGIAVSDINGDGLEDFFIGGAFRQSGEIFIQNRDGSFKSKPIVTDKKFEEDMGALFFDADNDGDADLYIVSGGNEFENNSPYYQDRLYVNDGRGNFKQDNNALPIEHVSGSCVIGSDYDHDGDIDLFIGGRLKPQSYPNAGDSFILENRHGRFIDVTDSIAPGLRNIGMVNAALWTDFDLDNQTDLIVVGEWMPITFYKNDKGKLRNVTDTQDLKDSSGWWNSIAGADIDNDGDTDYVLGNLGLNSRYQASVKSPMCVYVGDFNADGQQDALFSQMIAGKEYPAHPRDDLFQRLPSFKKFYSSYDKYATETMQQLIERVPGLKTARLEAKTLQSCLLINMGHGKWTLRPLPLEAQFGPVYGILLDDFTDDHQTDILLTGNSDATEVLTGRYDALKGLLLKGNEAGNFEAVTMEEAGVCLRGDGKGIVNVTTKDGGVILAGTNNEDLQSMRLSGKERTLVPQNDEVYCTLLLHNGKTRRVEFYFGSGYLSQTSRRVSVNSSVKTITFFDRVGKSRKVDLNLTK